MEVASDGNNEAWHAPFGGPLRSLHRRTMDAGTGNEIEDSGGASVKHYSKKAASCAIALIALLLAPSLVLAQGTGDFLCSAGSRDGQPCAAFSDCPGGVCIIAQGICNDGDICVCPGGGECVGDPVCSSDACFGTCAGGLADGVCCDTDFNCSGGACCNATHKLCLSGDLQGFPCLDSSQCDGAPCDSTGFFCDGGAADGLGCVTDADCPGGNCDTSFVAQPTSTPVTPGATQPPTTPTTAATAGPTNTQRPFPTVPTSVVPPTATRPPENTRTPIPPTATFTPVVGTIVTTATDAPAGANKITVAIDPTTFPVQGVVDVGGTMIDFTRRRSSTVLDLKAPAGLPFPLAAGSAVRVVEYTPTPGPRIVVDQAIAEGDGCAVVPASSATPQERRVTAIWLAGLAAFGILVRRRRG